MSQADSSSRLVDTFKRAVEGLFFPSESDYPFEVRLWQGQAGEELTPETLLQSLDRPVDTPVETADLQQVFAPATAEQDWYNSEEQATAQRFRSLVKLIEETLIDVKVYRLGQVEIDVYIVGKIKAESESNDWLMLSTQVVET
jgi:hypothetical protein